MVGSGRNIKLLKVLTEVQALDPPRDFQRPRACFKIPARLIAQPPLTIGHTPPQLSMEIDVLTKALK